MITRPAKIIFTEFFFYYFNEAAANFNPPDIFTLRAAGYRHPGHSSNRRHVGCVLLPGPGLGPAHKNPMSGIVQNNNVWSCRLRYAVYPKSFELLEGGNAATNSLAT
ncbi:hypothetical protein FJU30_24025 [Affinibrenneria salicis]|uniref:Uncharacterized protein n=1 Tax=Affinibrenneria salicis TaxID=2590031 RepID=A0A5J5FSI7_9GAMM|nr:hypothetical protein [Affinibrenneria salicis]KAA8995631.1 hypothetical protein FJU30_24025 [Affinibrenneria salicis]